MNARLSKTLRRKLGFKPGAPREYKHDKPIYKMTRDVSGNPSTYAVTGTIRTTGARRSYQAVKRNPVLRTAVMRAA